MASCHQYALLSHCECRLGILNHGPYSCRANEEMLVRDFFDLSEGDLPWLDGIASECHAQQPDDPDRPQGHPLQHRRRLGSFEAEPSYDHDNIAAVGMYTSDSLSDG